jgi:hypothetical protein
LTIAGAFNPSDPTYVIFTDRSGHQIRMDATHVSASSITVPVPIYLNHQTLKPTSGTVSVQVQQVGPGAASFQAFLQFKIAKAPSPRTAGTLAEALINQTTAALTTAIQNYQKIGSSSGGKVNVAPLDRQITFGRP